MAILRSRYTYKNIGLLLLRIGVGVIFILHGWPKMAGGPEKWEMLGKTMSMMGIDFFPVFWGFMAAFAEAVGGLMIMLGLFFRPACVLLLITMLVATLRHVLGGDGFGDFSHSLESSIIFLSLLFIGPGKYSLDKVLFPVKGDRRIYT